MVLDGQPDTDLNWWHDIHAGAGQDDFDVAVLPLAVITHMADLEATYLDEVEGPN